MTEEIETNRENKSKFHENNIIKKELNSEDSGEDNADTDFQADQTDNIEQTDEIAQSSKADPTKQFIDIFQQPFAMDYYVQNHVQRQDQDFNPNISSLQENENETFVSCRCVCRLCAKTDQTIFMRLFDDTKTMTPIAGKISYLMGNSKVEQDVLPQQICLGCSEMVDSSYIALQQFYMSHQILSDIAAHLIGTMSIPGLFNSKHKDIKLENQSEHIENDIDDFSIENNEDDLNQPADDFSIETDDPDLKQPSAHGSDSPALTGIKKKRIVDKHYLNMLKEPLVELKSCNYCGRIFQSTFNDEFIKSHILVHLCSPSVCYDYDMDINTLDISQHVGTTLCYLCSFCKVPKPSPVALKTHLKSCCSTFANKYNLKIPPQRLYRDRRPNLNKTCHYCKTCKDGTPFKRKEFRVHMKDNHPDLILNCLHCSSIFFEKRPLQAHIKMQHLRNTSTNAVTANEEKLPERSSTKKVQKKKLENTPVMCEYCSMQCMSKSGYANHLKKVHLNPSANPNRKISFRTRDRKQKSLRNGWEWQYCHVCEKTLQFKEGPKGLEFHLLKHKSPNNKVECCNREYEYYCKYKNHIQSHSKSWVCKICGETCASMVLLQDHLTACHTRRTYCEECKYESKSLRNYHHHMQAIHHVINVKCPLCDQVCKTKRELEFHHRQFHWTEFFQPRESDLPEPVICCGKKFLMDANLKRHIAKHRDISCKTCGDWLKSKLALLSHNANHHKKQGVKCVYCDKMYTSSDSLKYHLLKHTHGRQIKCVCGLSFYTESDMRRHQRTKKTPCKGMNVEESEDMKIVVVGADVMDWSDEEV
uniref:Zinc finger protein 26 n=1 Tax=Cacopsylla melanoneura TaxID=428564 RepID=A0A8D9ESU8_9HEMI